MNDIQLSEFKQQIAKVYDRRKDSYDLGGEDNWHLKLARHLVEYAKGIWNDITTFFVIGEK